MKQASFLTWVEIPFSLPQSCRGSGSGASCAAVRGRPRGLRQEARDVCPGRLQLQQVTDTALSGRVSVFLGMLYVPIGSFFVQIQQGFYKAIEPSAAAEQCARRSVRDVRVCFLCRGLSFTRLRLGRLTSTARQCPRQGAV